MSSPITNGEPAQQTRRTHGSIVSKFGQANNDGNNNKTNSSANRASMGGGTNSNSRISNSRMSGVREDALSVLREIDKTTSGRSSSGGGATFASSIHLAPDAKRLKSGKGKGGKYASVFD